MSPNNSGDIKPSRIVGTNPNEQMSRNLNDNLHHHHSHHHQVHQPQATFTIATPAVTTILPMTENINDASFMLPATSYQRQSITTDQSSFVHDEQQPTTANSIPKQENFGEQKKDSKSTETAEQSIPSNERNDNQSTESNANQQVGDNNSAQEELAKLCNKRNKVTKKNTKLDAKSKLEKSRQSARECRARKKLRYQYLEDLVCNREKAVIKLREELSMFCELSKQIDVGAISDKDRQLLTDQIKENA